MKKAKLTQLEQRVQNKIKRRIGITCPKSKLWRVAINIDICPRCGSDDLTFDDYGVHWHCLACIKANRDYIFG